MYKRKLITNNIVMKGEKNMKKKSLLVLCLTFIVSIFSGCGNIMTQATQNTVKDEKFAVWMWQTEYADMPDTAENLSKINIDNIYITPREDMSENILYASFLKNLNLYGISAQALLGTPEWTLSDYYNRMDTRIKQIFDYNSKYENKFTAIHLDIEPYLLPDWENNKEFYFNSYCDNMTKLSKEIKIHNSDKNDNLKLILDIPFWYDKASLERILSIADEVTVMDYTDDLNDFILRGNAIFSIADQKGKKVNIGIDLNDIKYDEILSYAKTSKNEFKKHLSFGEIAIHDYAAIKKQGG